MANISGLKVDAKDFNNALKKIADNVHTNTILYANNIGKTFDAEAKAGAKWKDRKGVARRGLRHEVFDMEYGVVDIYLEGSAPKCKRGQNSVEDYMEYLEFDHGGKYAIIYPVRDALVKEIRAKMGDAVILGRADIKIKRDKHYAKARTYRARRRR